MNDVEAVAWLGRKVGWGFSDGQQKRWSALGPTAVIGELVNPDAAERPPRPDPFADIDVTSDRQARVVRDGTIRWIENAVTSPRPLETFMEFFWSDYFAVSARVVRPRHWMFGHMNLLAKHSLGNFAELLRSVTIDAAMLDFLDGRRSTRDNPNENYGRELLELYSVGVGEFSEADVKAASRALTGWKARRRDGEVIFRRGQHDDSPQTLLGTTGVHDLDTTIAAVLAHPATSKRVVDKLALAILGTDYDVNLVTDLADQFGIDWELRPVVSGLLELGVAGHATPSLLEPLAWYVLARRLPTAEPQTRQFREYFRLTAQLPLQPPNVGGFPAPDAYLSTSATIARFNMASHLADRSARSGTGMDPIALTTDLDFLADRLGLVDGFQPATQDALTGLMPGVGRLAATLASPDLVVA